MELIISEEFPELLPKLLASEDLSLLFDQLDLKYIQTTERKFAIPDSLMKSEIVFEFAKKSKSFRIYCALDFPK